MSSIPFMPLWVADFVRDTLDLDAKEIGAYMLILMAMWGRDGYLPSDEKKLQRVARCGRDWPRVWSALAHHFTIDGDRITQARLLKELQKVATKRAVSAQQGARGGRAKALKSKERTLANASVSLQQLESELEEEKIIALSRSKPKPERFDEFWAVYPHRGGVKRGRKPALEKFTRLVASGTSEQTLIDGAARSATDRQVIDGYARDPATWLHQEGWTDDVSAQSSQADPDRAAKLARMAKLAGAQ